MIGNLWKSISVVAIATCAASPGTHEADAQDFHYRGRAYYSPVVPYVYGVPPVHYSYRPTFVPPPGAVYSAPHSVYAPPVPGPPIGDYYPRAPYSVRSHYRLRPRDYEYEHKVYSPYRLGPVYEYEFEDDDGKVEIEEDFD